MSKIKLLYLLGGIVLIAAAGIFWRQYSSGGDLPNRPADAHDQASGNSFKTKDGSASSADVSSNKENGNGSGQKPDEKAQTSNTANTSVSDKDLTDDEASKKSEVSTKKFDSDEDEEDTDDGVTVETEPDDE